MSSSTAPYEPDHWSGVDSRLRPFAGLARSFLCSDRIFLHNHFEIRLLATPQHRQSWKFNVFREAAGICRWIFIMWSRKLDSERGHGTKTQNTVKNLFLTLNVYLDSKNLTASAQGYLIDLKIFSLILSERLDLLIKYFKIEYLKKNWGK